MGGNGYHDGSPNDDDHDDEDDNYNTERDKGDKYHREFKLVSPNKIVVPRFSGTSLATRSYMPFNKAAKKLIKAQGPRGIQLLTILERVETYGDKP